MQPISNWVIVKVTKKNDEIKVGDKTLYLDTSFEKEKNIERYAEVVFPPKRLNFEVRGAARMEQEVDMELRTGDIVYFHFNTLLVSEKDQRFIIKDNEKLYFIPYNSIYCAKRRDDVVMINGWVLVEPKEEQVKTILELPKYLRNKESMQVGTVKYIGNHVRKYFNYPGVEDSLEINKGDVVFFDSEDSIPMEYDTHNTLGKLYRMQRKDILAKKS